MISFFFFQAEDGIRDFCLSRGLGDVYKRQAPEYISRDLRECAGIVGQLDAKMLSLNEAIQEAKEKQEHEREEKIREDEHH